MLLVNDVSLLYGPLEPATHVFVLEVSPGHRIGVLLSLVIAEVDSLVVNEILALCVVHVLVGGLLVIFYSVAIAVSVLSGTVSKGRRGLPRGALAVYYFGLPLNF